MIKRCYGLLTYLIVNIPSNWMQLRMHVWGDFKYTKLNAISPCICVILIALLMPLHRVKFW